MSLVIASNQVSDSISDTNSSIFKPWNFRNDLSSTYTIPANGQVALQSVKYNLDGTIDLANDGQVLYQYTGEILADGTETMNDSTAVPIRTELFEGDGIEEVSVEQLAEKIELAINKKVYHPMLRDLAEGSVKRAPSTNEFQGFNIVYKTNETLATVIPAEKYAQDGLYTNERDGTTAPLWTYTVDGGNGEFTTVDDQPFVQSVILWEKPVSLYNGSMVFNIVGGTDTSTNSFGVGATRFVINPDSAGSHCVPEYFLQDTLWEGQEIDQDMMCDFFVYTDPVTRLLKVAHAVSDTSDATKPEDTRMKEIDYLSNTTSHFSGDATKYDFGTNTELYEKVKFYFNNQRVKVTLIKADLTEHTLIDYDSTAPKGANFKPINQSCWDLFPYMWLQTEEGSSSNTIYFEGMDQCSWINDYADSVDLSTEPYLKGSWYNLLEGDGQTDISKALELRPWNDYSASVTDEITIKGLATSPFKFLDIGSVLIFLQSDLYSPSIGANSGEILGFDDETIQENNTTTADLTRTIASTTIPQLLSTKTMFVRLDNFTQTTTNAYQGNRSSIIAHLPRFDGQIQTGRIYHEPKNLIFLDLHNSEPLNVNSFDISFCYSNEQYVEALTGQSVVVLYFREKPQ